MRRWAMAAVPLLAVSWAPSSASADPFGTIVATAAGVVVGGVIGSTLVTGTTATIVGAAIGGGIAYWWYDSSDDGSIEALPRKSAVRTGPEGGRQSGVVLISAPDLRVVATKR